MQKNFTLDNNQIYCVTKPNLSLIYLNKMICLLILLEALKGVCNSTSCLSQVEILKK